LDKWTNFIVLFCIGLTSKFDTIPLLHPLQWFIIITVNSSSQGTLHSSLIENWRMFLCFLKVNKAGLKACFCSVSKKNSEVET
jgi:hypothetical protein